MQPIPVKNPGTEALLEHHLVNADVNAKKTHELLEHHLVKGTDHAKRADMAADNHLEMQGKILQELQKPKPDVQKVQIEGADVITIKGQKGDKGDKGDTPSEDELKKIITPLIPAPIKGDKGDASTERGPKGDKGDKGDAATIDYAEIYRYISAKISEIPVPKDGKPGEPGKSAPIITAEDVARVFKGAAKEFKISYKDLVDAPEFPRMAGQGFLNSLADVSPEGLLPGQALKWDGKRWIPFTPSSGGGGNSIYGENVSASGSGVNFKLVNAPIAGSVRLYRGGAYQKPSNYTVDAAGNIVLLVGGALDQLDGEELVADYNF